MTDQSPTEPLNPAPAWDPSPPVPQAASGAPGGASGVVVAAGVILLVIATLLGLFGILAIFGGAMMSQITNFSDLSGQSGLTEEEARAAMELGRVLIFVLGGVALAIGLAHLLSGIGVLRRRGWARILGLVMSILGVLLWLLVLVSTALAATQPIPAGYLEDSGLTVDQYRSITATGWIIGMAFAAIGLAAYGFVLTVLIRRGREFA